MRVAIVTECFLPEVNGVTNSVLRVLEHLARRGHEALILAPGDGPREHDGIPVVRLRSVGLPRYRSFALGLPSIRMRAVLTAFAPDVVHLASPVAVGAQAAVVAGRMGLPTVAVYQTDVAGFVARYGLRPARRAVWAWLRHVHGRCDRTLAPSTPALWELRRHGVPDVHLWARGVDATAFAPAHRDPALRARLAPAGELVVGYVGRLAAEKRVDLLAPLCGLAGVRVVVVGDGPARRSLEQRLPGAAFLGFQRGAALSAAFASLDVFVHPGADETFCQAAQEALASGVPVVAAGAGGLLDVVHDGRTGLLWPAAEPGALVAAVRRLVDAPALRARLAAAARPSVLHRSWDVVGDQLLGHYEAVRRAARAHPLPDTREITA